jgi:hypothetical protein
LNLTRRAGSLPSSWPLFRPLGFGTGCVLLSGEQIADSVVDLFDAYPMVHSERSGVSRCDTHGHNNAGSACDVRQAIYEFNGADPQGIIRFGELPGCTTLPLGGPNPQPRLPYARRSHPRGRSRATSRAPAPAAASAHRRTTYAARRRRQRRRRAILGCLSYDAQAHSRQMPIGGSASGAGTSTCQAQPL